MYKGLLFDEGVGQFITISVSTTAFQNKVPN